LKKTNALFEALEAKKIIFNSFNPKSYSLMYNR